MKDLFILLLFILGFVLGYVVGQKTTSHDRESEIIKLNIQLTTLEIKKLKGECL